MKGIGTLKYTSILLVVITGLLLCTALLVLVQKASAAIYAPEDCLTAVIEGPSGFINRTWDAAPNGDACLILQIKQSQEGNFNISAGWVYTAPLKIDGEVVSTTIVEGQMAPQIDPVSFPVISGTVLIVEPSWNPTGTEVGFWWTYSPPQNDECVTASITGDSGIIHQTWAAEDNKTCIELHIDEPENGVLSISSGWVYTSPLTIDGNIIPTRMVPGELAPQINPVAFEVTSGSILIVEPSKNPSGTEIGFWWDFLPSEPPLFSTFLPLVQKPMELLETDVDLNESPELQVITAGWQNVPPGQEACLNVNFKGTASQALVESGWLFGTEITQSSLNDIPFNISPPISVPGEQALQISGFLLSNIPRILHICFVGTNPGLEIGLRFRYPTP